MGKLELVISSLRIPPRRGKAIQTQRVIPDLIRDPSHVLLLLLIFPIISLVILNFLLAFTPEMGFDALWYHLTLPKLWLLKHQWYFSGGLLYYSVMPRLVETLYIPLIHFTGTVGPKLVQFFAGLGTLVYLWKLLSHFQQTKIMKLVGLSLFYCTWLVSWQSGSAYIDLVRTFLEVAALYFLVVKGSWKIGGVFLGLVIGTKWLSLGSLAIFSLVFGPQIIFPALIISLPWFAISYFYTGNPIYPIFSGVIYNSFLSVGDSLKQLILSPYLLTRPYDDFVSPLAGLIFVVAIISLRNKNSLLKKIALVGTLGTLSSLVIDPPSSRFFLPYFPAIIIASVVYLNTFKAVWLKNTLVGLAVVSSFAILGLRLVAMKKYLPLFTGQVSEVSFLTSYSPRLPGAFIDTDGFVASLPAGSRFLVDKLHNLYYFPVDFNHTSWVSSREGYDFLVTIGEDPKNIKGELINTNQIGIQVFKLK